MVTPRGRSLPGGACRRCSSSPGTPATPSSSRRCRPRHHHLGLRRQSAPRSVGRGSTSRTDRLLLRRLHLSTSSFARGGARTRGPRAADAPVGEMGTVLLLPGGGAHLHSLEQHRGGWGGAGSTSSTVTEVREPAAAPSPNCAGTRAPVARRTAEGRIFSRRRRGGGGRTATAGGAGGHIWLRPARQEPAATPGPPIFDLRRSPRAGSRGGGGGEEAAGNMPYPAAGPAATSA
jgi:hypothetical protein